MIAHWSEAESWRAEVGHLAGTWTDLGRAAGSRTVGLKRIQVDAGRWSTPAHAEGAEDEILYVLAGSGVSRENGEYYDVRAGDCLVHLAGDGTHTLRAGDDALDVLAFGERVPVQIGHLPRARVAWLGDTWVDAGVGEPPWQREVGVGEPDLEQSLPRPSGIVNLDDVPEEDGWRNLGRAAGSLRSGLKHVSVPPRRPHCPPHCHSLEEELFVLLDGEGTLELTPSPGAVDAGREPEQHAVRAGDVVSRPAGTWLAHSFRAGDGGMTLLAYGTKNTGDIAYYPRSNKIAFRGVGVIARLDHLAYELGEESAT